MPTTKKLLVMFLFVGLALTASSQTIEWKFAPKDSIDGTCASLTDCSAGNVCYFVEYTPAITGTLTSYTMGFISNCNGSNQPVNHSASCVITDNSNEIDACAQIDSMLIQLSGFGSVSVVADEAVVLHQICFDLAEGEILNIRKDPTLDITTNIDSLGTQDPYTEIIDFDAIALTNEVCDCFRLAPGSGSLQQTITCLAPIQPLLFEISNCSSAQVVGLPPGLSYVLINGVINIEGSPQMAGAFPFVMLPADGCDCDPQTATLEVGNSRVMINNACFDRIEDAIIVYQNGQTIDILDTLVTQAGIAPLNNIIVRLHENVPWTVKGN